MSLYEVHARKWQNGWELRVDDVGVTWSPTLGDAETRAREFVCSRLDVAEETVEATVTPSVADDLDRMAREARDAIGDADEALRLASAKARQAMYGLTNAGLTTDDVCHFLNLSEERLRELVTDP